MNIAFCISGHLRHYKVIGQSYLNFKKTIEQYGNIDTFVCTWDRLNTDHSWSHFHDLSSKDSSLIETNQSEIEDFYQTQDILILDEKFYASEYSPLNYKKFTHNTYNWDDRGIYNNVPHCVKTMYLIYKCNELKNKKEFQNKKQYDLVLRLRPDAVYTEDFSVVDIRTIKPNTLYVTLFPNKVYSDFGRFAFGDSTVMDKYSSAFLKIDNIFDTNIFGDPEKIYHNCITNLIDKENIEYLPNWVGLSSEKYINFIR